MSDRAAIEECAGAVLVNRLEGSETRARDEDPEHLTDHLGASKNTTHQEEPRMGGKLCEQSWIRDSVGAFAAAKEGGQVVGSQRAFDEIETRCNNAPLLSRLDVVTSSSFEEDVVDDKVDVRLDGSELSALACVRLLVAWLTM